ncbi:hypothetical protein HFP51_00760 [Parasphingopyxis sp. CP4]|uniref:hypothetical protein n=1 Tax=Parasphingopyxis sp. CP4 TaxID=2724527 RepID=UPI0015A2B117|nr:hypothetical protein [Parasphingopyxis sp. CP4]QLC20843.1 hypothetical protein HFP51_00760 [Parasphingopyxis sp. CP4]
MLVAIAAIATPAHAQEAEYPPAQQQRPPVFDLQPGPVREEPQPDVQGPRAPGLPAPRLIEDEEQQPPPVQAQPQPQPQTAETDTTAAPSTSETVADQTAASVASASEARRDSAPAENETPEAAILDTVPPPIAAPTIAVPDPGAGADIPTSEPTGADGLPWWVWIGLLLAIGAAIAVVRMAARNRTVETPKLAPAPVPQPKPAPVPEPEAPPAPPAIPAPKPLPTPPRAAPPAEPDVEDRPSRIIVDFQPTKARLSTVGLTVSYRLDVQNVSDEDLTEIVVRLGIRCTDGQPGQLQISPEPPCVALERLKPGERHVQTGVIRLDPEAYRPVQSDGKPMIVPVVDMLPKYRDGDGELHEMHAEMLVGREHQPPQPKMQPFWLERGFGQFEKIGCRMVSVTRL